MVATTAPFRARLEEAVRGQHSQMHPFTDAWVNGQLTRRQLGEWARQHYHYVGKFSQWCGTVYGRCPDQEARDFLLENMWEEEMGNRHSELLIRFAEACGFSRDDVLNVDVLPTTRGLTAWCHEMANAHSFLEAAAGLSSGSSRRRRASTVATRHRSWRSTASASARPSSLSSTRRPTRTTASVATRSSSATPPRRRSRTWPCAPFAKRPPCAGSTWEVSIATSCSARSDSDGGRRRARGRARTRRSPRVPTPTATWSSRGRARCPPVRCAGWITAASQWC